MFVKTKGLILFLIISLLSTGFLCADTTQDIEDLIDSMTLDEKIGQMVQAEMKGVASGDITTYFLGSILSGGGSVPGDNTPEDWADKYDAFQDEALATRLAIPIIYGIDAVHGHSNVYGAVIFPHNIGLGCTRDPDLIEEIGRITAKEVAATGLNWTFAPCVAVTLDERWGRSYESFGETPELQNLLAGPFVLGLQGSPLVGDSTMDADRIVACAKHYIGDGGTIWGTSEGGQIDQGDCIVDEATLRATHLPGYIKALEQGVGTVMASYNSWNGDKMHGHYYLITTVLKNELGFDGFVVSDWNAITQLPSPYYYNDIIESVNSGIDMFMIPWCDKEGEPSWKEFISNLKAAVTPNNDVSMTRIDDAVRRILRIKFRAGLFDNPYADRSQNDGSFGSAEHRDVAREAVRKSLVLLKNENDVLPISGSSKIFVAGKSANNLGFQCGGWTIEHQGFDDNGNGTDKTLGTTILQGIKNVHSGFVTYNKDGIGASGHDVAIVVIGETPYAEIPGDDNDLSLYSNDITCLNNVYAAGIPVVVIMVSGRPMIVTDDVTTDEIDKWDAFVAAWLPGTEGEGIAEVLFGYYDFTGKLSVSWPKSMDQIPINYGDSSYDPLFEYGYGLEHEGSATSSDNLALGKPVTASSEETSPNSCPAMNAVDSDTGTRWASDYSDSQWIYVDLGNTYDINRVVLNWEAAYATEYKIQISADASDWTDIFYTSTGDGGSDDLSVTGTGRYVRMLGMTRKYSWAGYSLWEFEVYANLALEKSVTSSSYEGGCPKENAVDGNTGTRWSSLHTDDQWIYVDLGNTYTINRVYLLWETAYGKEYKIQVSNDATSWTDIFHETNSDGGADNIALSGKGRYIKMLGIDRNTQWGYSLYEFEVYGELSSIHPGFPIPGVIQAEDYDTGGEGVSYHDSGRGNGGGAYRITDVDIESCTEGGYNIGFVQTDEWMKYTVNVSAAGTYDIKCRVATTQTNSKFKIYFNDVDKTGEVVVPNTGGWQTWQTVTVTDVYLEAGKQIMKVELFGEYNLNYIEIE